MIRWILPIAVFFLSITPWIFTTKILFLSDPPVWPDEAIFTDTALNIVERGQLKTDLFGTSIPGLNERALWYPPLYFYILAVWIKIFGAEIGTVRTLSAIVSFLSLAAVFVLMKRIFKNLLLTALGVLLISTDLYFSQASRTARMDILNFLFINLALIFLFKTNRNPSIWGTLNGISGGLAVLTHPYGIIAPLTSFIYVFSRKWTFREKSIKYFKIILPVVLALLVWGSFLIGHFENFQIQYALQFQRKSLEQFLPIAMSVVNPVWFLIYVSYMIFYLTYIAAFFRDRTENKLFLIISLLLIIPGILWGKEFWFMLYFQPFAAITVILLLKNIGEIKRKWLLFIFYPMYFLIIATNTHFIYGNIKTMLQGNFDYHEFTGLIGRHIRPNSKVFLASIPDPYFDFRKARSLTFFEFPTVPINLDVYQRLLDESDYIVYNMPEIEIIKSYAMLNGAQIKTVRQPGGYSVQVIELVPRNRRVGFNRQ